jgi:hypothetical protein
VLSVHAGRRPRSRGLGWRALLASTLLAGVLVGVTAQAAVADCTQASPWPSFTRSAPAADRILIGTVVWTPGGEVNGRFTLRVDEVLRGTAPATIHFHNFRSGAPQPICPEDSYLRVHDVGERLAFAYAARLPGVDHPITAVAYLAPSRPDPDLLPQMERLTVAQVRAIAALPQTDAALPPAPTAPAPTGYPWALIVLGSGLLGALAFVLRQRGT